MRGIILTILAIAVTVSAVFFVFNREELSEIGDQQAAISVLPKTMPLSELETQASTSTGDLTSRPPIVLAESGYIESADKYLEEALSIPDPKQRFVLIEKINAFKDNFALAINVTGPDLPAEVSRSETEAGPVRLIRATARYIAAWSPFYYYIHPDAQRVLSPAIKMLEQERAKMFMEFVKKDARRAGQLATEDVEYYIEDIRKSAARRNSDFIDFSVIDYQNYRKIFDELGADYEEFRFGFAQSAHRLFDDLYRMHEEVDEEYSEKTRKKVGDVRLEFRELHKQALLDLGKIDQEGARKALGDTISIIELESSKHKDFQAEIHDIMKSDYEFYKGITL